MNAHLDPTDLGALISGSLFTGCSQHFFTSFGARDRCFMLIFRLWQNTLLDKVRTDPLLLQKQPRIWQLEAQSLLYFSAGVPDLAIFIYFCMSLSLCE